MKTWFKTSFVILIAIILISACNPSTILDNVKAPAATEAPVYVPAEPTALPRPTIDQESFCTGINQETAKCVDSVTSFGRTDKIYFGFHIKGYPEGTNFKAEWFYGTGKPILNYDMTSYGSRYLYFFISPGSSWQTGDAYLNLSVDGNLYKTYYFTIY